MAASSERMLVTPEMTELKDEVWDDPVDVIYRLLVSPFSTTPAGAN
jgi:hypothetical protein